MQKLVRDYLDELKKQRKRHRKARIAVILLIALVVGTVTGGLTRNGITMTEDAQCGLIEHEHTDECYQEVLICGYGGLVQEDDDAAGSVQDASVSDSLKKDPVPAPEKEAREPKELLRTASAEQTVGHHHTDDCYELRDVLLCGEEESEGHTHTDDCYEIETSLECGQGESEGHTHTDACYETETEDVLACDSEDDEDHEHTDDCYRSESTSTLTCGEEESEGHTHTEACEVSEQILTCGKEEYTGHEHTDDCYGQDEVLICGQEEREESVYSESSEQDLPSNAQDEKTEQHIHTKDCYELQPVCGIPEHTHSEECLIDITADVEDASDWDAQYADVEWTDAWGADLVTAAQMQVGYRESKDNYRIAEDGSHKGYTRYGAFAGDAYVDWDAAFVNFCMYYAGLMDTDIFPQETDAGEWYDAFVEADENNIEYLTAPEGYEPEAGDLIFFEREKEEEEPEQMMGIVSSYDEEENTVTVIEGNSDNEVRENTYDIDDEQISAYLMITTLEESVKTDEPVTEGTGLIFTTEDVEDASEWDTQYADVEWTGVWGADLVTAAQMQIGYRESEDNYEVADDGSLKGYTRYGAFAGDEYADWNAAFVNFCMYYAGLADTGLFPQELDAGAWYDEFAKADEQNMEYLTAPEGYEPEVGDLVFFERETEEGEPKKEMGIVSSYDAEQNGITVIEGDSDDEVRENTYDAGDEQISSYLMITALEEESVNIRTLTAEGEDYTVEVRFTEDAGIPEDAILDVREIEEDSDEYQEYYEQSLEAMGVDVLTFARYFYISFLVDGEEIEPLTPVNVTITYADDIVAEDGSKAEAVHFTRDGDVEVLDVESNVKLNAATDASMISEEGAEEDLDTGNDVEESAEEDPDTDAAEEATQKDPKGNFFRFNQNSFSATGTVIGASRAASPDGGFTFRRFNVTNLDDLDGNIFLITNGNNIAKGEQTQDGLVADTFDNNAEVQTKGAEYAWKFERIPGTDQFYIYSVSAEMRHMWVGQRISGTNQRPITLEENQKNDPNGGAKIEVVCDGTGTIKMIVDKGGKYYINGGDRELVANIYDYTNYTLYKLEYTVVLNPTNVSKESAQTAYHFRIDWKSPGDAGYKGRISETISSLEITLPDDAARQRGFPITAKSTWHGIENVSGKYQWKLKGWYNVADGMYYSVEDGSKTITLDPSKNNVFYADWVAASYNNGSNKTALGGVIQNPLSEEKTQDFIHTQLFDYSELVNITLNQADWRIGVWGNQTNTSKEYWWCSNNLDGTGFHFADGDGIVGESLGDPVNWYVGSNNNSITDTEVLNKITNVLFPENTNATPMGVQYVGDASGLYQLKEDNYYVYDSDSNAVSYNQDDKRFYVYNRTQKIGGSNSFLPLNGEDEWHANNDGRVNYWFGMKTELDYWLNDDSSTSSQGKPNYNYKDNSDTTGKPMVFQFVGDDDVWVYDQYEYTDANGVSHTETRLVLNLTGTHGRWSGYINFSTGNVGTYRAKWEEEDLKAIEEGADKGSVENFAFKAGKHKLIMYYLERGANISNCKIRFNLVPSWKYMGGAAQKVTVTKEWKDVDGNALNDAEVPQSVEVELYKVNKNDTKEKTKLGDSKFLNKDNGWSYSWYRDLNETKDENGNEKYEYLVREVEDSALSQYKMTSTNQVTEVSSWIENSSLANGDLIVIGNGVKGDYQGYALKAEESGITAEQVDISEFGDLLKNDNADIPGVSEYGLSKALQWKVHIDSESDSGNYQFRLESVATGKYLSIKDTAPMLADSREDASVLYFSMKGNLTGTSANQLVFKRDSNTFAVVSRANANLQESDEERVHLYKHDSKIQTRVTDYKITNTLLKVDLQIQKVDKGTGKPLKEAKFELYSEDNTVINENLESDGNGLITIKDIQAGTYYLEETVAPEGYMLLPQRIKIVVSKSRIGTGEDERDEASVAVDFQLDYWSNESVTDSSGNGSNTHVTYDLASKTFLIKVPNVEVYTLPDTGGIGIYWYMFGGVLLMISAVLITYKTKLKGGAVKS